MVGAGPVVAACGFAGAAPGCAGACPGGGRCWCGAAAAVARDEARRQWAAAPKERNLRDDQKTAVS